MPATLAAPVAGLARRQSFSRSRNDRMSHGVGGGDRLETGLRSGRPRLHFLVTPAAHFFLVIEQLFRRRHHCRRRCWPRHAVTSRHIFLLLWSWPPWRCKAGWPNSTANAFVLTPFYCTRNVCLCACPRAPEPKVFTMPCVWHSTTVRLLPRRTGGTNQAGIYCAGEALFSKR